jgi:hypothetical protein
VYIFTQNISGCMLWGKKRITFRYINRIKASIKQTLDFANATSTFKGQTNILAAGLELEVRHQ